MALLNIRSSAIHYRSDILKYIMSNKGSLFRFFPAFLFLFCRLAAANDADQSKYYCDDIKKDFFASPPGGIGKFTTQRPQANPGSFVMPKPAGVKRVFVIGESVAALLGSSKEISVNGNLVAEPLWRKIMKSGIKGSPGPAFEIINCGMGGYESYRIYAVLKEVLNYSPDLIVILSGNQEGGSTQFCPGLAFELLRRELRLLERYYSLKSGPQEARKKASLKRHAEMLAKMARTAKKAGVPVMFCTLPANSRDMPSRGPLFLGNDQFNSGYRLFYERKYAAALQKFTQALSSEPREHFANFYAAKTLEKLGRPGDAKPYFQRALSYSYNDYTRADNERNAAIKTVAASEGVCVADLEKAFTAISPSGLPGFPEFTDGMHWRPLYNKMVWANIFQSAGACGIKGFETIKIGNSPRWTESRREDMVKRLTYAFSWVDEQSLNEGTLAELAYIKEASPGLLKEAAVSPHALNKIILHNFWTLGKDMKLEALFPFILAHLAETERRAGNYAEALSLCDRAAALKPGNRELQLERAQILSGLGRKEEAEEVFLRLAAHSDHGQKARALAEAYGFTVPAAADNAGKRSGLPGYSSANKVPRSSAAESSPAARSRGKQGGINKAAGGSSAGGVNCSTSAAHCPGDQKPGSADNADQPRKLLDLCLGLSKTKEVGKALQACQSAAYSAASGNAAADASFESYLLLKRMGRIEEAREMLLWTTKTAPASWPGLGKVRKLLEGPGSR